MVGNNIIESGLKVSKMYIDFILIDRLSCLMRISLCLLESQLLRYCGCNMWFIKFTNNESLFYVS